MSKPITIRYRKTRIGYSIIHRGRVILKTDRWDYIDAFLNGYAPQGYRLSPIK